MTEYHNVALLKGDLNGKTVSDAVLEVDKEARVLMGKPIEWTPLPYGDVDYYLEHNIIELGEKELSELKKYEQIFLGAVGDPTRIAPGIMEVGTLLKIRQEFDQYVNLRPVILPEGVPSIIVGKNHKDINFIICRENSEGLYVDAGWVEKKGTEDEAGYQIMKCTYKGVKRLMEYAVEKAKARKKGDKPTIHIVFKTNILTYAAVPWKRVLKEYQERDDITVKYMHIDNFMMQMVGEPKQFDVVITENMFGDISTDLGAMIQGGIGTAVSGNINPTGKFPSMFEPIHGTAPDKWYEKDEKGEYIAGSFVPEKVQQIRPEAALLAYAMMLEHMGELRASKAVENAVLADIKDPDYKVKRLDQLVEQACGFVRRAA